MVFNNLFPAFLSHKSLLESLKSPYLCTASGQLQKMESDEIRDNMIGNCTDTKADITVKTVLDGKQIGQQAFMKLI